MVETINLKKFEIRAFTSTFKDGLLDIFLGLILLQFVIGPLLTDIGFSDFEASAVFVPFYLIGLIFFMLIKKYVTKPRMGVVKPGPARKTKLWMVNVILFIVLLISFILGLIYTDNIPAMNSLFPFLFSITVLVASFTAAYFLNLYRLFLYGILIAFAHLTGELLWSKGLVSHHGFPLMFGILSFALVIFGLILFIRFLLTHPIPMEEN
ncbi:hypothetical protein ACFLSX_00975 [Calditrichota bacterium]